MRLQRFVVPFRAEVLTHLTRPLRLLGLALGLPAVMAALFQEWSSATTFSLLAVSFYLIGRFGGSEAPLIPSPRDALVTAALAYLLWGAVGGLAYWRFGSFLDGFFEAMSGFTTTGLSLLPLEALPRSLVFFRAYSQWIGGAGIVILTVLFLPGPRNLAFRLSRAEATSENLHGSVLATSRTLLTVYSALTFVGFLAYLLSGMGPFDALCHALATLSTGGFSGHRESIGHYPAGPIFWVAILLMLAGATTFPLYYHGFRESWRRFLRDPQFQMLTLLFSLVVIAAVGLPAQGRETSVLERVFHLTSAMTTTGFSVTDVSEWSPGLRMLSLLLMTLGGSLGSTAGGIKLYRVIVMWQVARWWILKSQLPEEATVTMRYGSRELEAGESMKVLGVVVVYLLMLILSTILITFAGFSASDALFESASALGTVGLTAGVTSTQLPGWAKLVLVVDMWAGRLEVLPVLLLLYPRTWWRPRGES